MKKSLDNDTSFQPIIFTLVVLYLPRLIFDMVGGISNVQPWQLGLFYIPALLLIYYRFNRIYKGIKMFLLLLFFSFMIYPTTSFYLYQYDSNNYHISSEFQLIEKLLAQDKMRNQVSMADLEYLASSLKTSNSDFPKIFCNPSPIQIDSKYEFAINDTKSRVVITRGDSIKTEFIVRNRPPRPDFDIPNYHIIQGINREIENINKLKALTISTDDRIPFSEFWVESITSFASGHIQPARNFPKLLNAIQILSILFLSTIVINSINNELGLKRKKGKKKKKKK